MTVPECRVYGPPDHDSAEEFDQHWIHRTPIALSGMMHDVMAGPFFLATGLLVLSGLAKARRPGPTSRALAVAGLPSRWALVRTLGFIEVAVGTLALARPGPAVVIAVATLYALFAAFVGHLVIARIPGSSCGCAGGRDAPPSVLHVVLNLAAASAAVAVAFDPPSNLVRFVLDTPLSGAPLIALLAACGYLATLATSLLPEVRRLVKDSFRIGHDHGSRAGAPARPAVFHLTGGPP